MLKNSDRVDSGEIDSIPPPRHTLPVTGGCPTLTLNLAYLLPNFRENSPVTL